MDVPVRVEAVATMCRSCFSKQPAFRSYQFASDTLNACNQSKRGEKHMSSIRKFLRDESGLTATEYAIAGGLVGAVVIGAFQLLGTNVGGVINFIAGSIQAP